MDARPTDTNQPAHVIYLLGAGAARDIGLPDSVGLLKEIQESMAGPANAETRQVVEALVSALKYHKGSINFEDLLSRILSFIRYDPLSGQRGTDSFLRRFAWPSTARGDSSMSYEAREAWRLLFLGGDQSFNLENFSRVKVLPFAAAEAIQGRYLQNALAEVLEQRRRRTND